MDDAARARKRRVGLVGILVLAAVGCSDGSGEALSKASCLELEASARATVLPAFTSNVACTVASDCLQARFAASCFDSCTSELATSGVAAVEAAIDSVEASQCKTYHDGGCVLTIPPCVPPLPVACNGGRCTQALR